VSEYYHVILETNEKIAKGKNKVIHWFDCQSIDELDEDIISPYVKEEQLYIDGHHIKFADINSLIIKKSQLPINSLVDGINARRSPGIFFFANREGVVQGDNGLENVTRELVKSKKKEIPVTISLENKGGKISDLDKNNVFIVHGHDNEAKLEMARFLEKAGLNPIILHEQASSNNTIIEKIEAYSNVGYAVILYTPCDVGSKNEDEVNLSPRARQNVVFEHGYFIGHLGRSRVSAFMKGNIEKPNDISGVVYTDLDTAGAWKMSLLKELKKIGYQVKSEALL
jgi:predicted nucleotide-binding protein